MYALKAAGTRVEETAPKTLDIPVELFERMREYMAAGKHGNITWNMKNGRIISWSLTEVGRINRSRRHLVRVTNIRN